MCVGACVCVCVCVGYILYLCVWVPVCAGACVCVCMCVCTCMCVCVGRVGVGWGGVCGGAYLLSLQQIICFDSADVPATLIINNTMLRTCFFVLFVCLFQSERLELYQESAKTLTQVTDVHFCTAGTVCL